MKFIAALMILIAANLAHSSEIVNLRNIDFSSASEACRSTAHAASSLSTDEVLIGAFCDSSYLGSNVYSYTLKARAASEKRGSIVPLARVSMGSKNCSNLVSNINLLATDSVMISARCESEYIGSGNYTYTLTGSIFIQ